MKQGVKVELYNDSFYPTYEELKWVYEDDFMKKPSLFLPYLWGIEIFIGDRISKFKEIRFYPTYEELKFLGIFGYFLKFPWFLPYLWGIEIILW